MERHLKVVMSHESLPLTAWLDVVVIRATSCAQDVTLQVKIDQNMPVWLSKLVLTQHCCTVC